MNRISGGQFAALLLTGDAFAVLCIMGNISVMTSCGFVVGIVIQFLLALPAAYYYKNGGTLKNAAKPFMWFYLAYIILWGGLLFVMLWNAAEAISIPSENFSFIPENLLIPGLIAAVCLYASSPGAKALARASVITAVLGALCLIIVIISAFMKGSMEYLTEIPRYNSFFDELSRGFVLSGGLGSFIVFLGYTKGDPVKYAAGYFAGKAILFTSIPLMAVAAAGGIMKIADFPVITAAQLSQPFSSQRIDSLFLIIFVILAVFAVSVQTVTASFMLSGIFPGFKKFRSTFVLALMIGVSFLLSGIYQYSLIYCIAVLTALIAVPLIMTFFRKAER